jgi:mannose-6-phosphate isomerase-like protein (cupin superfamily)
MLNKINLEDKFALIHDFWNPRIIGELNGQMVKLAKLKGDFVWHSHEHEDEYFQVFKGSLHMEFRDRTVVLEKGDVIIVPRGVEHNPHTLNTEECWVILFEPKATLHTGNTAFERANNDQQWI